MNKLLIAAAFILFFNSIIFARTKSGAIVSLAPSITYSIYSLGLENEVSGVTSYCPKGNTPKEIIGTLLEPNIEKIISLKPRVVMVSKEGNRKEDAQRLEKLGIKVYIAEHDYDYDSLCSNFLAIGKYLGAEKKAREIINNATERLQKIKQMTNKADVKNIFWEIGSKPLFTAGARNFINDYSRYIASSNIFSDIKARFAQISVEEVIKRNPDAILIVSMQDETSVEQQYWMRFPELKAVMNNRVLLLEWSEIYAATPANFASSAEKTARLIHPEVFNDPQ